MTFPVSVEEYTSRALEDDRLYDAALDLVPDAATLFARKPPRTTISASDCGRCALELWAQLHDRFTIPDGNRWPRLRGTFAGALYGALLKVALEDEDPALEVRLETETLDAEGITGHSDVAVYRKSKECLWVCDLKTTAAFSTPLPHEQKKSGESDVHYAIQVNLYAASLGSPLASIARLLGAGNWQQADYEVSSWRPAIDAELKRLRTAEGDDPPPADPSRKYLCESCQFGACPDNRNPLRGTPAPSVLDVLQASVAAKAAS